MLTKETIQCWLCLIKGSTMAGFEPTPSKRNWFLINRRNHLATSSYFKLINRCIQRLRLKLSLMFAPLLRPWFTVLQSNTRTYKLKWIILTEIFYYIDSKYGHSVHSNTSWKYCNLISSTFCLTSTHCPGNSFITTETSRGLWETPSRNSSWEQVQRSFVPKNSKSWVKLECRKSKSI